MLTCELNRTSGDAIPACLVAQATGLLFTPVEPGGTGGNVDEEISVWGARWVGDREGDRVVGGASDGSGGTS